ncbi:uncharacterized protein LOC111028778 [Myzus persicae]|uniref:uncharacterized protein LOC111028778 n=1 Tax=Myzus persicae TaxID=13164 RepID=UPI000B939860|nr:uncharacterized protein LOC111028778 [Myzus persicae]
MSSNTFRVRKLTSINNENPIKNIKNSLATNRKKTALKVLTNTVQSTKKSDGKGLKQLKVLPMKNFETEIKCKSPLQDFTYDQDEEFDHYDCTTLENDALPSSMTCNIGMLSDFFSCNNNDPRDFFLEDYHSIMIEQIKNQFDNFGEPEVEYSFPSLPVMDFPEIIF